MSDHNRGLYRKFDVRRTDGSSAPGGKHDGCSYFVLDLTHDEFAVVALGAYADACAVEYPDLARDLRRLVASGAPGEAMPMVIEQNAARYTPEPEDTGDAPQPASDEGGLR